MSADRLLALYERIADAPSAIARLRRFILDLAVRGKLVPQDPTDGLASELLRRIAAEKARLVRSGEIRKERSLAAVQDDETPFELPFGWSWVRLGSIVHLVSGQHLQPPEYSENSTSKLPYVTGPSDFGPNGLQITRFALVRKAVATHGQLLLTVKGSGIGKSTTCDLPEVAISRQLMALTAIGWEARFLVLVTHLLAETLRVRARSLIPGISREDVDEFVVGLPPSAEQRRIVAKVDELMALCDRLEAARAERETKRDRLTAASLARLNVPNPETFENDARFALGALPAFTTRLDQIKQLRQTILNLAVCGKLVPQDPTDEPASELLKRISADKSKLRTRKASNDTPLAATASTPYSIPRGWAWSTSEELAQPNQAITYGILKPVWVEVGVPTVKVSEMKTGTILVGSLRNCDSQRAKKFSKTTLAPGDLLVSKDGTIGKTAFVPNELAGGNITQHILRFAITPHVNRTFVKLAVDGPTCQEWMVGETKGVALQGVNVADFRRMPIPIPPLAEQHRIVAKVDELMALCDRLEASLATGDDTRRRLLDALLAEALAPPGTLEQTRLHEVMVNDAA